MSDNDDGAKKSESPDTFYYAYCNTEGSKIGGAAADRTVAQNRANHHNRQTGHSTTVISE